MPSFESAFKALSIINDSYRNSLNASSDKAEQPAHVSVPLRSHQLSILYKMEEHERLLSSGMDISGATLYSRFAILGDGVGVGKSLMILGHIARLKEKDPLPYLPSLTVNSCSEVYSLERREVVTDVSEGGSLVIVPHTLFRQWQTYIKEQTKLKALFIQNRKAFVKADQLAQTILESDIILVSNTLYGVLQTVANSKRICWKRVFYDEADTLHISSTQPKPSTRFTWLISASWINLLLPGTLHYLDKDLLFHDPLYSRLVEDTHNFLNKMSSSTNNNMYYSLRFSIVSRNYFNSMLSTNHPYRGSLVLRCSDSFVEESIQLPPITLKNILCRRSIVHQIVANAIPPEVRLLLHAGDITGALQHLGVKPEEPMTLVQAVTENRMKELDRLQKTLLFKESLEYSSAQVKEQALKTLKEKIRGLSEQIQMLKERIENYKDEMCPICFDEPQNPLLTSCCTRIFCAACILASMTRTPSCPLCRTILGTNGLRNLATNPIIKNVCEKEPEKDQPLKKVEQLLAILKQNPNGKFLVFSRYDNPFTQISSEIEACNIRVKRVSGNKDVIANSLKSFQTGETQVLLLNSIQAGAGMNITAATHVILLHAMNHEEEKQILGRAYRLGRKEPLEVIRLLHAEEMNDTHENSSAQTS
jgi:hypothetical protein